MRVIGLISGTSVDGIDAALIEITGAPTELSVRLIRGETCDYPSALQSRILDLCHGASLPLEELAELDDAIAQCFAEAALQVQGDDRVDLIGSHGQTVFHRPRQAERLAYSLQLGRGMAIAHHTGLPTVNNFRQGDIAAGGEGAPLAPAVDAALLRHPKFNRCVQNIGGIGNVTYLPAQHRGDAAIVGWDTGPGNALLDLAVQHLTDGTQRYDQDGAWAAQGTPCLEVVQRWLDHPYFRQTPPKSTGRELFGQDFLNQCQQDADDYALTSVDFLATLTEFTALSIADSYQRFLPQMPDEILVCGGGNRNPYLCDRLRLALPMATVKTTSDAGLDADFKEAIAFAVLAYWRMHQHPGNLPTVTGADQPALLGEIHLPA
ncbi:anhydro-N-acetylmuramic acid kinase [Vacuolonema iberomarrocanum]|uniref:anhydro-N-acetylmuramic acid kinase n=1 Tax=Vacuolonema iberomarrocanum TaxID=3454632 RepID=UPI0019EB7675|nr:anhydro-N-acetylmuramic acid kinase [filamentous cyanobacterium LEGE 07170]